MPTQQAVVVELIQMGFQIWGKPGFGNAYPDERGYRVSLASQAEHLRLPGIKHGSVYVHRVSPTNDGALIATGQSTYVACFSKLQAPTAHAADGYPVWRGAQLTALLAALRLALATPGWCGASQVVPPTPVVRLLAVISCFVGRLWFAVASEHVGGASVQERLAPEERLAGLAPEQLGAALGDNAMLALPDEALRSLSQEYVATLSADVLMRIKARLSAKPVRNQSPKRKAPRKR